MRRVVLDELMPGMRLARAVTNANGLPVVAAGAELDGVMIERFHRLGLASVFVEGEAVDTTGKTLAELQAELEHRFRSVRQDPIQQKILQHLIHHMRSTHGVPDQEASNTP